VIALKGAGDMAMSLGDYLTPDEPLGPIRHEGLLHRYHNAYGYDLPVNVLIYHAKPFDRILENLHPIILGRRGSGKTAIIAALLADSGRKNYFYRSNKSPKKNNDTFVFISSMNHFDDLVNRVGLDCLYSFGTSEPNWDELSAETAARYWERHLWETVFNQIFRDSVSVDNSDKNTIDYRAELPLLFKYKETGDIIDPREEITTASIRKVFEDVRDSVVRFFETKNIKCVIVVDSLDKYTVSAPRFSRILSGFLRCITNFIDYYKNIRIYCCMPEEIESVITTYLSNELRDMSPSSSYSRLRWRPFDLFRIVAERYREFLKLHFVVQTLSDREFMDKVLAFDFSKRDDLNTLYSLILPSHIINKYNQKEDTLAYIVRHTQLLPREFILLFSEAMKVSHDMKRPWSYIEADAIVKAVSDTEASLARSITKPFKLRYRNLIDNIGKILPSLPPICTLSNLDTLTRRMRKIIDIETDSPWDALYEMGVIGYIETDESKNRKSDYYLYGCFHFNSTKPIVFADHMTYCVHPVFSGTWNLKRDNKMPFVYPSNIGQEFWKDNDF